MMGMDLSSVEDMALPTSAMWLLFHVLLSTNVVLLAIPGGQGEREIIEENWGEGKCWSNEGRNRRRGGRGMREWSKIVGERKIQERKKE